MSTQIKFRERLAYAVGDGGCNFVWTTVGSFLTLYYTDHVGIAAATIGTIMLISRLLDGISDLVMGTIIDRTNTKWGKARPWILWSSLPMAIGLILLFSVPDSLSYNGKVAYSAITYTIMAAIIYTACNLSYNTLLALISSEPHERVKFSSLRFFITMIVVLFINYTTLPLVQNLGWSGMAMVFGGIAILMLLITFFFTTERNNAQLQNKTIRKEENKLPVKESFKLLFKNKYFLFLSVIFVMNYTALGVNNGLRIYFAKDVLGNVALIGTLTLFFLLPKLLGNLIYPTISKAIGNWNSLLYGYILMIAGLLLIEFSPTSPTMAYIGLAILGIGGIPHTAGLFALVADVVDYGEWKTNVRLDGLTNSAVSFGMKVGAGLGAAIVGWGLAYAAYDGSLTAQTTETASWIKNFFTWCPIILYSLGLIALLFCNVDKYSEQIRKEIALKRS